jgi:hypothetical protein
MDTPIPPSPVPGDRFLIKGQHPFTAFGQFGFGSMDFRVFEQDIYWLNPPLPDGRGFPLRAWA